MDTEIEYIRRILSYNEDTGEFRWKQRAGSRPANSLAGSTTKAGYGQINFSSAHPQLKRRHYHLHVLAYMYVTGERPSVGYEVHHVNSNRMDNRWVNLELTEAGKHARMKRTKSLTPRSSLIQRLTAATQELEAAKSSLKQSQNMSRRSRDDAWLSDLLRLRKSVEGSLTRALTLLDAIRHAQASDSG